MKYGNRLQMNEIRKKRNEKYTEPRRKFIISGYMLK